MTEPTPITVTGLGVLVPLPGTNLWAKREHTFRWENDPGLACDFEATFVLDDEYHLVLDRLTAIRRPGGPPVTTTSLRKLNTISVANAALTCFRRTGRTFQPVDWQQDDGESGGDYVRRIVVMADATGQAPRQVLMQKLGLSESAADAKLWWARRLGVIPPVKERRG